MISICEPSLFPRDKSHLNMIKEISPGCSLEGLCWSWNSSTLATWCKELSHWKRPWFWERLRAGGEGDDRGWDGWMPSPTQWTWVWVDSGMDREAWHAVIHGVAKSWTQLSNWTELSLLTAAEFGLLVFCWKFCIYNQGYRSFLFSKCSYLTLTSG